MKLKVTFREYSSPYVDPETQEEERGEFMGSFSKEIEGESITDILDIAGRKAEDYSEENGTDVRVWETAVVVTPSGIRSL